MERYKNILLHKQHRLYYSVKSAINNIGMHNFTCTKPYRVINSKPFGIFRIYTPFIHFCFV